MSREIICADAFGFLKADRFRGDCAIVTSPPDAEEVGMAVREWLPWFEEALMLCLGYGSPVLFYLTDRLYAAHRISKAGAALRMAFKAGMPLIWHKIALRRDVGAIDLRRPGYSHILAFGSEGCGPATPDTVIGGRMVYPNATGLVAARAMVEYAMRTRQRIIDPFCGRGTIPAVAEALGAEAIGIDIDAAQCGHARKLNLRANLHQ